MESVLDMYDSSKSCIGEMLRSLRRAVSKQLLQQRGCGWNPQFFPWINSLFCNVQSDETNIYKDDRIREDNGDVNHPLSELK